jgi:predicted flap endonuclease-1-like 5' DNA nuclease
MFRKYRILIAVLLFGLMQTACSGPAGETRRVLGIPWWVWLLVIVVVALLVWWWLSQPKKGAAPPARPKTAVPAAKPEAAMPTARPETAAPSHAVETPEGVARRAAAVLSGVEEEVEEPILKAVEPDDLKLIEGIGPKISSLLQAAGITTFAHLASTDVKRLKQIIAEAGLTALADPTTWPEQATLAAAGKWDALEKLQAELRGGRRV